MQCKELIPRPAEPYDGPRCCAQLQPEAAKWRARWPKPDVPSDQCGNKACVQINGKYYCRKHGGIVALDILITQTNEEHAQ